jgi:hypothetical protein
MMQMICTPIAFRAALIAVAAMTCWSGTRITFAHVTYSWSGHLRLFDEFEPDPWLIGIDGADFTLTTSIARSATDFNESQIPYALFVDATSRLWVDGEEATFVGDGYVDFSDITDVADLVTAGGIFSKQGQVVEISSVVSLDASTFAFLHLEETPPVFESVQTAGSGLFVHQPYAASVESGTLVTVTPEPAAMVLTLCALAMFSACMRRRR